MVLWQLFLVFFRVGLFAVGGAYSFLPLLQKELVERYHWLTKQEFIEVVGITKIFPGAISIKFATYTGYKIGGVAGAAVANIGNFVAPAVIVLFLTFVYTKYRNAPYLKGSFEMIQLVVFAMIIAVAFQMISISQLTVARNAVIIILAFSLFIYTKIEPAFIILGAGLLGAWLVR